MGGTAGAAAVGVAMLEGESLDAQYLGPKLRLSVRDLGVLADGTGDDGARLTAGLAEKFGTFATTGPRTFPVEIDFGDLTLHLKSPIIINQSFIEFVGSPKFFCDVVPNAIVVSAGGEQAIVFGTKIKGTLMGHVEGDGVLYQQGSQGEIDIRNVGYVGQAVVHVQGSYRNDIRVQTHGEGITCYYAYRESVLQLPAGPFNCINSNITVVAYDCYGVGVLMEESQGFDLRGDIERCAGPGVDLYNCQNGVVAIYTEKNGLSVSNTGYDTPDDIRIRSGPAKVVPNSDGNIIQGSRIGGEPISLGGQVVVPNSVHVINAYRTLIEANVLGGNVRIEAGSQHTMVGQQSRFGGSLHDEGLYTIDHSTRGRMVTMAARYRRLVIDGLAPSGAVIGSDDGLLKLYGLSSFGAGTTLGYNFNGVVDISGQAVSGRVTFPRPEPDANFFPVVSLRDVTGGSATGGYKIRNLSPSGFDIVLNAAPGDGQIIRANYLIVRTS